MSIKSLRTEQQMYDYAESNGLISQVSKNWSIKHFRMVAESLDADESVLTAFIGFHNYRSMSQHDGCFAYVITNKRFIMAQKKLIGGIFQAVSLQNINDITLKKGIISHTITIDTIKEVFNVETSNAKIAQNIHNEIHAAIKKAKSGLAHSAIQTDLTAQLVELKRLADAGVITRNDFEAKKRQLLGI